MAGQPPRGPFWDGQQQDIEPSFVPIDQPLLPPSVAAAFGIPLLGRGQVVGSQLGQQLQHGNAQFLQGGNFAQLAASSGLPPAAATNAAGSQFMYSGDASQFLLQQQQQLLRQHQLQPQQQLLQQTQTQPSIWGSTGNTGYPTYQSNPLLAQAMLAQQQQHSQLAGTQHSLGNQAYNAFPGSLYPGSSMQGLQYGIYQQPQQQQQQQQPNYAWQQGSAMAPLMTQPAQQPVLQPTYADNYFATAGAAAPTNSDNSGDYAARAIKKPRLVWTPQLHQRFEEAVEKLGVEKAIPKNIMAEMNVEGLTRENVASHLQKYRMLRKRGAGGGSSADAGGATTGHTDSDPHETTQQNTTQQNTTQQHTGAGKVPALAAKRHASQEPAGAAVSSQQDGAGAPAGTGSRSNSDADGDDGSEDGDEVPSGSYTGEHDGEPHAAAWDAARAASGGGGKAGGKVADRDVGDSGERQCGGAQ